MAGTKIYSKNTSALADLSSDPQSIQVQEDFELTEILFSVTENGSAATKKDIYFSLSIGEKSIIDPGVLHLQCLINNRSGNGYKLPEPIKISGKTTVKTEISNKTGAALTIMTSLHGKV